MKDGSYRSPLEAFLIYEKFGLSTQHQNICYRGYYSKSDSLVGRVFLGEGVWESI